MVRGSYSAMSYFFGVLPSLVLKRPLSVPSLGTWDLDDKVSQAQHTSKIGHGPLPLAPEHSDRQIDCLTNLFQFPLRGSTSDGTPDVAEVQSMCGSV